MGKALYRTYRSRSFDEVVGQDHITTTLKNSLENSTIGHAYLLTGPRGVGKTTIARLLAYAVNDIEYDDNQRELDIIEIDAASNRRIEEIRSLRDKVHIAPASLKYKVYIIDEVHMLTKEAFNALLKTLEEPPAHVIFILATTEIHKLPDTIISRCIRFTFKPILPKQIASHLNSIAKQEKIKIDSQAIALIAEHAGGSFRDAISLLDQVKNNRDKIDKSSVELMLGLAPIEQINRILDAVNSGNTSKLYQTLEETRNFGSSESRLASQLSEKIRDTLINSHAPNADILLILLEELLSVPQAISPSARLEIVLLKATLANTPHEVGKSEIITERPTEVTDEEAIKAVQDLSADISVEKKSAGSVDIKKEDATPSLKIETPNNKLAQSSGVWVSVLEALKSKHNTLYGVARMASAQHEDQELVLCFRFPFHYKKIDDAKSKAIIADVMKDLGHENIILRIELDTTMNADQEIRKTVSQKPTQAKEEELSTITNIFGTPEMLES